MSSDQYLRSALQKQKELVAVQTKKAAELRKLSDIKSRIVSADEAARKATSVSTRDSRLRDSARYLKDAAAAERKVADFEKAIGQLQAKIADDQRRQIDEERREQKKRVTEEQNRLRTQTRRMATVDLTLARHSDLHARTDAMIKTLAAPVDRIIVLFLASNPIDQQQLRLDEEARSIGQMIRSSKHRDAVHFETRWALQTSDLLQALNECQPTVVHFSGHGSENDEIVLQSPNGNAKAVSKEALVQVMKTVADNIRLVFFNTCYSDGQAEAVVEHVEAAIGMNTTIGDDAARVFSSSFYSAIGFGLSVQKAFDQARAALMLEGIPEHETPALFIQEGFAAAEIVLVAP